MNELKHVNNKCVVSGIGVKWQALLTVLVSTDSLPQKISIGKMEVNIPTFSHWLSSYATTQKMCDCLISSKSLIAARQRFHWSMGTIALIIQVELSERALRVGEGIIKQKKSLKRDSNTPVIKSVIELKSHCTVCPCKIPG